MTRGEARLAIEQYSNWLIWSMSLSYPYGMEQEDMVEEAKAKIAEAEAVLAEPVPDDIRWQNV